MDIQKWHEGIERTESSDTFLKHHSYLGIGNCPKTAQTSTHLYSIRALLRSSFELLISHKNHNNRRGSLERASLPGNGIDPWNV